MKTMLIETGANVKTTVFLFTDNQIKVEGQVEDVNNLLNTGEIPNIYAPEDKADIIEKLWPIAKLENKAQDGSLQSLFGLFVEKCKKHLHIVLCFSPIGESLRKWILNFPSLVNCTTIDWFSDWPADALDSVAKMFLDKVDLGTVQVKNSCVEMVKHFHESTIKASQ